MNVLILDDEARIREEISEYLTRRKHKVYTAPNPSLGFEILDNEEIELMILDIRLPEMDGLTVLRKVKNRFPEIEVIMMTETGKELTMTSTELLPGAFSDSAMEKNNEL